MIAGRRSYPGEQQVPSLRGGARVKSHSLVRCKARRQCWLSCIRVHLFAGQLLQFAALVFAQAWAWRWQCSILRYLQRCPRVESCAKACAGADLYLSFSCRNVLRQQQAADSVPLDVAHGVPPPRAAPPLLRRVVLSCRTLSGDLDDFFGDRTIGEHPLCIILRFRALEERVCCFD